MNILLLIIVLSGVILHYAYKQKLKDAEKHLSACAELIHMHKGVDNSPSATETFEKIDKIISSYSYTH